MGPDRAEGTAVLSDEERTRRNRIALWQDILLDPDRDEQFTPIRPVVEALVAEALAARAALPGTADTGAREAVERVVSIWEAEVASGAIRTADARYCWTLAAKEVRAALAATPDGHQHAAEES